MRSAKPPAKSRSAARSEAWRARPLPTGLAGTLRRLREARDWTQADLAERAGLAFSSIQALESGRTKNPTLDTAQKLAAALGVAVDELTPGRAPGVPAMCQPAVKPRLTTAPRPKKRPSF